MKKPLLMGALAALAIAIVPATQIHAYQIPPSLPPCGAQLLFPPQKPYVIVQCAAYTDENTGQHYDALYFDLSGLPIN